MEKAKKELGMAYMFYDMYNTEAFWKGSLTAVTAKLKKLDTDGKKRHALNANISIRVIGFGWKDQHITWTKNRTNRPIKELAAHCCPSCSQ